MTDPSRSRARGRIAYLPENVALYDHLSGMENADYLLALAGEPKPRGAIGEAFVAAGLGEDAWDRRLSGYSKGMRQKVAIAIIEKYRLTTFLGNYGAGRTLQTFSLLPGEKTKLSFKTYKRTSASAKAASSVLDSYTQESAREFERSVGQEMRIE